MSLSVGVCVCVCVVRGGFFYFGLKETNWTTTICVGPPVCSRHRGFGFETGLVYRLGALAGPGCLADDTVRLGQETNQGTRMLDLPPPATVDFVVFLLTA